MSRIAVADNQQLRFDRDLVDHWTLEGHEVKYEMGASEFLFEWCDLYYVNFWDHNLHYLWNWHKAHPKVKKPKIVCRALDYEVWLGLARGQELIDWVDYAICIAPHIERKLKEEADFGDKLHLIRPGINLQKFTEKTDFNYHIILPCNEIDWILKNTLEGIKIFAMLKKRSPLPWKLAVKGKWTGQAGGEYFRFVISDFLKKNHIEKEVRIVEEEVPDYNAFLEEFSYCLQPSLKEAFSFVTAECMAKNMKPIINSWYGAEEIWNPRFLYKTPEEAVRMFLEKPIYNYRHYIESEYRVERMLREYDELLNL